MADVQVRPPNPQHDKCACGVGVGGRKGAVYFAGHWLHRACWLAFRTTRNERTRG